MTSTAPTSRPRLVTSAPRQGGTGRFTFHTMKLTPLGALIERVKAERGESDEDLAVRARRKRNKISKQNISLIRTADPLRSIVPETVRALADALEVPLPRVVEAALLSAGLPLPVPAADWSPESAIQGDPDLPEPAKRLLLHQLVVARGASLGLPYAPPADPPRLRRAARRREEL